MRLKCGTSNGKSGILKRWVRRAVLAALLTALILLLLERNLESVILDMAYARAEAMAVEYIHELMKI